MPPDVPSALRRRLRRLLRFRLSTLFVVITLLAVVLGVFGVRWYRGLRETWAVDALRAAGGQIVTRKNGTTQRVWLGGETLSDAKLKELIPHLHQLFTLEELDIVEAPVTDEGLMELQQLRQVRLVYVHETKATDAGFAKLNQAMPGVDIRRERPNPVATRLAMRTVYPSAVIAAAFSPKGKWFVTGSGDGSLRWWDTSNWELIETT